ncbi:uncharacterized protein LOC124138812 isoform X3 [Haliotis rufescens]|uniref:uncharacterized protein LOC124138812 isoform X3 n=1 Tax=Haliotis rufescens TaxID=6454 RepID=UPI00201F3636|nr:uncharacterized protein LOC124138812 isoform X3 [Haliotis rufescens]
MKSLGQTIGVYIYLIFLSDIVVTDLSYSDCGGFLTEERGFIKSPKFPHRFPTPISCHWVIQAPPERKIILYFTQYFLRSGFYLSEYDQYHSEVSYTGKNNLGEINFEDEFTSLVAYKPYVVITFNVRDNGNIHLRVEDYLQDVYGFNITYEVVGLEEKVGRDACSVHECSYLGNCVANFNYSEYRCDCFEGFFGKECQYGPYCDPDKGTNMCENGGRCRYFYGSLVNTCECPPGYEGSKCHLKTDRPFHQDCENLGCSQLCEQSQDGSFYCSCLEGFKLDTDNATCMEKEMYRITVTVPVRKGVMIPAGFTSPQFDATATLKGRVIYTLDLSGIKSVTRFGFDGVRDKSDEKVMAFHFYVENIELELVYRGLQFLTTGSRLFGVEVDNAAMKYQADPEMKLLGVEHYGQRPAVEGNLLTIMCTARGSGQMKYRWYKDGSLLNTTLSQRNAWEIRIPRTIRKKQISVLNIDGVEFYDKGEFTCEIEDFNEVDNASVIVDVITLPLLEMSPLAVSLTKGGATSFRCLSPDDTIEKGTFTYRWLKNDNQIPPDSPSEIIEDVFPTGRRLNIRNAQHSANYTCIITNPAGSTNKTAHLFVKTPEDIQGYCLQDIYEGITWKKTFGGCFDVQRCPTDTGDLRVLKALDLVWLNRLYGKGYSKRWCKCIDQRCEWSKPNFVKCQSGHLIITFDRLEKIKLGYQHDKMASIWEDLYGLIRQARGKLYAGDVDVSSSILHTFVKTLAQYPSLAPRNGSYSLMSLLDLTNILMAEALLTTSEEKESLYVGPKVMQIAEMTCGLHLRNFNFSIGLKITTDKIVALMENVRIVPPNASLPKLANHTEKYGTTLARGSRLRREKVSISTNGHSDHSDVVYSHEPMFICHYVDMYSLLHDNYAENIHDPDFITEIRSVFPLDNFYLQKIRKIEIVFKHPHSVILQGSNETTCISWRTVRSDVLNGHWSVHDCDVIQRNATSTTCWCDVPGHFALVVKQINVTIPVIPDTYEGVLLAGCVASMCGLVLTLIAYLFTWRHLVGETHYIHINFVLSLTIINVICIACLGKTQIQTLCAAGKILLQFFYLAAFAFLFVEAVHMFVTVHSRHSVSGGFLKYFLIGWGIPTLATGSVVVASERYGYDESCHEWCWLSDSHWHFYSFLVPVIVLVVAQLTLCTVSVITVRGWKEEWRYKDRRKHMLTAGKCGVLQVLLTMSCVSGTFIEHNTHTSFLYIFLLVEITLGTTVFCFLVLMKRQIRLSLVFMLNRSGEKSEMTRKFSSRSFKAYMMPEKIDEQRETIEESIHRHQSEINRNKFTRERKKQLEHLLGSSSSGSASGSGSDNSRESQIRFVITPHRETPGDSGISDSDISEICSTKNTVDIHYISPVPEHHNDCDADLDDDSSVDSPSEILVCASRMADRSLVTLHT